MEMKILNNNIVKIIFILLLLIMSATAFAEETFQPVKITSKRMEVVKDKNLIVFAGDVVAATTDMTILADELHIYYDDGGKEVRKMVATGSVRIKQEQGTATAERAEYNKVEERIILTGNPKFKECRNVVEGEKITVYLREEKSVVEGSDGNRVKAVLFPDSEGDGGRGCP
ncbi:MAG: lipopolysaccharide transport periplasmic protein LptA [Thermodesulfobacteriota bacterium]